MRLTVLSSREGKGEYPLIAAILTALAILYTWPLVLHLHNGIIGNYGDPLLNNWIMSWTARNAFTRPTALLQGNIMYPCRDVLAYSEHLLTLGILSSPIYHSTHNPVLAYNILLFLGLVLSGFGCYILVKELTGSRFGGLAAGVFFSLFPYRIAKLDHVQIAFSAFLPYAVLQLYRYLGRGNRRHLFLFGLFLLLQSLVSWHYLVFSYLICGSLILWTLAFNRKGTKIARIAGAGIALLVVALLILPIALPYLRANSRLPDFVRTVDEASYYSARPSDYLRTSSDGILYGHLLPLFPTGEIGSEKVLNPGLMIIILSLAALAIRRRRDEEAPAFAPASFRNGALFFLAMAILGIILSFGPRMGKIPNALYLLFYYSGPFKFIRTPTRFFVLTAFSLSVLAGYGVAKIALRLSASKGPGWGRGVAAGMIALLVLETASFNLTVHPLPVSGEIPVLYEWLSKQGDVEVVELPTSPLGPGAYRYDFAMGFTPADKTEYLSREAMRMYFSIYHGKKICNGYSGYLPYSYKRIMSELQPFPSQRSIDLLRGMQIDLVVWHWDWVEEGLRREYEDRFAQETALIPEEDFGNEQVFRVQPGDVASTEELHCSLLSPDAVPECRSFNMSLEVTNTGAAPYVSMVNELQSFSLCFVSEGGEVVHRERGKCPPPFFLEPGESVSLPLAIGNSPPAGEYSVTVQIEEGVLAGERLQCRLDTENFEYMAGSSFLDGTINFEAETEPVKVQGPEGLYPLLLRVTNSGDSLWRAGWKNDIVSEAGAFGMVFLGMKWGRGDEVVWEEAGAVLPCDLAPGQSAVIPVLVRPPREKGTYVLFTGLKDVSLGWFGSYDLIEITVE